MQATGAGKTAPWMSQEHVSGAVSPKFGKCGITMATRNSDRNRRDQLPALQVAGTERGQAERGPLRSRPANENDPAIAMMLAKLRRQPSYGVYYGAFAISLAWIFGWFMVHSNAIFAPANNASASMPDMMRAVAVLVMPIMVIWALAYFQWRAQQMRQVSEVLMQSALRLVRPQDIASENLTSIAQAVRQEVDLLVGGVEHAYQRAAALEDIVHKEMSAVERAFGANEDRIRGLVSGLESQRVALQQTSQIVGGEAAPLLTRLENNTANLGQVINLALQTVQRFETGIKDSSDELSRTIDDVSARAAIAGNEIGGHSAQFERMSSLLISDFNNFSGQLQDYVQTLNGAANTLGAESRKFGGEVKGMETNLVQLLRQSAEQLTLANAEVSSNVERLSSASAAQIRAAAGELSHTVGNVGENITYHLKATSSEIAGLIEKSGIETAQRIEDSRHAVTQGLSAMTGDFVSKVEQSRTDMTIYVDQAAAQINSNYDLATNRLSERIQLAGTHMLAGLDQTGNQFLAQLSESGSDFAGRIEQASSALSSNLDQHANNITDSIVSTSSSLTATFDGAYGRAIESFNTAASTLDTTANAVDQRIREASGLVVNQMQSVGSGVNDLLVSTSGTIAAHLKETSDIVSRQMQDSGLALSHSIETSSGVVTERLISISGEFVDKLGAARDGMMQVFESSAGTLTDQLQGTTTQIYTRLEQVSAHIGDQMESIALRVNENIDTTAGAVTSQVIDVTSKLTSQLDASSTQLGALLDSTENRIGTQLHQATNDLTGLFTSNTDQMTDHLARTARELGERLDIATSHLDQVTGDVTNRLDTTKTTFVQALDEVSNEIQTNLGRAQSAFSEGLGQTTMQISARFEQETGLMVGRIDKASQELNTATSSSSKALDDAHRKFSGHIQTANTYFADQIATAATEMDQRLEGVSMQLTGKLEVTGTRISERLEDVTALVDRSMDKFNGEMERMLTNRKDTLDTLVSDASARANEVDAVMTSYMNLIEESLSTAENRAREISRIVADQTGQSLSHLEDELKKLEGSSATQVNQAARVLREQHERALASMNEMLSSTASDFQQTAQDMRITAQQVVKDIDAARGELKRAVIDLPEETRNNADAMRKVVADQISALNALSDVVRRQTNTLDFSGPGYIAPRGSGPGKSEGASFSAPISGTTSTRNEVLERNDGIEGTMAQIAASVKALSGAAAKAPVRRKVEVRDEMPAGISREISAYTAKLHAAAREVVEAVDDGLPRDLEKRFSSGDAGVYTKRLHEARGKRVVAGLTSRYRDERLLRSRINGYIRLFEKLLDTLTDLPNGAATIDAVLTSQNGEVYIMLAEAAGRLPEK